jgi:uncharacterized protein YbjT (DUF2867 family)
MGYRKVILLGASGLIGAEILNLIIADDDFDEVLLLSRRILEAESPKVKQHIVDFADSNSFCSHFQDYHTVFCAIGTTRKKSPDLKIYRKVDFDIPVNAIQCAEKHGVNSFFLVSSIGAEASSKNFYLKIKGEVEDVLLTSQIASKAVFRPSLLLGKRNERRFGERVAKFIMPLLNFLIPKRYRAIHAKDVAKAMVNVAKVRDKTQSIFTYKDIVSIA